MVSCNDCLHVDVEEAERALKSEIRIAEYVDNDFADNVSIALLKDTLDLINRQQAEINKLNAENMLTMSERNAFRTSFYEVLKQLKTAKSEAIKEFAEKLKSKSLTKWDYNDAVDVEDIDELVKEMVGENNG